MTRGSDVVVFFWLMTGFHGFLRDFNEAMAILGCKRDPTGSCFYVDPAQSAIVHLAGE